MDNIYMISTGRWFAENAKIEIEDTAGLSM
ncbi:hypothetical protein AZE42_14173 [Rhizopogon vesiculosus]|uniref:Uncharacterized protein n=1 Tax=Rhizopogon vesiculosus TaxID=180088 RepID=A0A1J8QLV6_9AGAM|nr:hypothetical protein AZE42_14173 [Rhizopogon vesiculosus]